MISTNYSDRQIDQFLALTKNGGAITKDAQGDFRRATWRERIVRFFMPGAAAEHDRQIAEFFIQHLHKYQPTESYQRLLQTATNFSKTCQRCDAIFQNLKNVLFAHKCHKTLAITPEKLVDTNGDYRHPAYGHLETNHLHYKIEKANAIDKETALLMEGNEILIRAKNGNSYLDTPEHLALILERVPPHHPDHILLTQLKQELEKVRSEQSEETQLTLTEQLSGHYSYLPLSSLPVDEQGVLVSHAYMSDGMENHHSSKWDELKTTSIEPCEAPAYKLRIVTKLPEYALTKTWFSFLISLIRNVFDFRQHGHSWVELVKPIETNNGFTGRQSVTNVGYYFHFLGSKKRIENADPISSMPIPKEKIVVEEIPISKETYEKGLLYINGAQFLIKNPQATSLEHIPAEADKEKIRYLVKASLKGTCLSFANILKEVMTGIRTDCRCQTARALCSKASFKKLDNLDYLIDNSVILNYLTRPFRFFLRMELPFNKKS